MIRYRRKIQLKLTKLGWVIDTDCGDEYHTISINEQSTPVTAWWDQQHKSELRTWQKDCVIRDAWDLLGPLELFLVYKKGQGYNQAHDLALAHEPKRNIWLLSTAEHTWVLPTTTSEPQFHIDLAFGSIDSRQSRSQVYEVLKEISQLKF